MTKKQKRDYYMTMIRNNLGWKVKDFKGTTFEEIEAKFAAVWKHVEDFIPMGSKEEAERLKRKGFNLEQEHVKKQKTSEEAPEIEKSTKEIPEEKMKEMMQLVPVEEVYVQALQVKHPIIDWKVHTKGQRSYWKIIRPKETGNKYFLGGKISTMMAPGESFMKSFEDIKSFFAMHTPSNDLIRTYPKKYKFPLPVKIVATARRNVKPLPE
nr:hypothetical protein [Tanacetum cinerariifolium]